MITEKLYRLQHSLIVWRHADETNEAKMHIWGELAHVLCVIAIEAKRFPNGTAAVNEPTAFAVLSWADGIATRVILHATPHDAYTTPAGVTKVGEEELGPALKEPQHGDRMPSPQTIDYSTYQKEAKASWARCWWRHGPLHRCPLCAPEAFAIGTPPGPGEICVILVDPVYGPSVTNIPNNLTGLQGAVGGLVEQLQWGPYTLLINEEGKLHDLPLNFHRQIYHPFAKAILAEPIVGPVVITKDDPKNSAEFGSLDAADIPILMSLLQQDPLPAWPEEGSPSLINGLIEPAVPAAPGRDPFATLRVEPSGDVDAGELSESQRAEAFEAQRDDEREAENEAWRMAVGDDQERRTADYDESAIPDVGHIPGPLGGDDELGC